MPKIILQRKSISAENFFDAHEVKNICGFIIRNLKFNLESNIKEFYSFLFRQTFKYIKKFVKLYFPGHPLTLCNQNCFEFFLLY